MIAQEQELVFEKAGSGNGENVPEGLWLVEVAGLEPYTDTNTDSPYHNPDPQARWKFMLIKPVMVPKPRPTADNPQPKTLEEWAGYELHDYSTLKMGAKAKARAWCAALLNAEIPDGYQPRSSQLKGKRAVATVGRSQSGRHKVMGLTPVDDDTPQPAPEAQQQFAQQTAQAAQASSPAPNQGLPF